MAVVICLSVRDVIPRQRNGVAAFGQLELEHHQPAMPECHFADSQIEFPHAAEPLVIKPPRGLALGGALLTVIGRMTTLTLGALIAALTNLLYADLAVGGARMQAARQKASWMVHNGLKSGARSRVQSPELERH